MLLHQMTPFHAAAEKGRCEKVLGLLIDKGGDTCFNIKDEDGVSGATGKHRNAGTETGTGTEMGRNAK